MNLATLTPLHPSHNRPALWHTGPHFHHTLSFSTFHLHHRDRTKSFPTAHVRHTISIASYSIMLYICNQHNHTKSTPHQSRQASITQPNSSRPLRPLPRASERSRSDANHRRMSSCNHAKLIWKSSSHSNVRLVTSVLPLPLEWQIEYAICSLDGWIDGQSLITPLFMRRRHRKPCSRCWMRVVYSVKRLVTQVLYLRTLCVGWAVDSNFVTEVDNRISNWRSRTNRTVVP